VYGIVLAGWASNNKYALLGGLRSTAQMISYEIAMGMSLIPVLLLAGNVSLNQIIDQQAGMHTWYVLNLTISFFIFVVAAFAETNRLPFDLPEAESELIAGYHTEYSAMKFSMFPISEYANMATSSALMATLKPSPISPRSASSGTSTASSESSAVSEARRPSLPWIELDEKPSVSVGTRNAASPLCFFSGSVCAKTSEVTAILAR
jgi:formate hydrogenlyase subunit 4